MGAFKSDWITNFNDIFIDKINGHINVFFYAYAVMKYTLDKLNIPDAKNNGILSLTLAIIICPIIFISILIFRCYRLLVYTILKLAHRKQFYSLLDGTDAIFNIGETEASKSVILNLLLIDHQGTGEEFYKTAKEHIAKVFSKEKFEKLHLKRRNPFMGYYYYLKVDTSGGDCIKTFLQKPITSDELQKYISDFANLQFPFENSGMWDVYIGLEKVTDRNAYPIIFRFHHCLCDASSIFNMFARDFTGKSNSEDNSKEVVLKPRPVVAETLKESHVKSCVLLDDYDRSLLCDDKINGDKELVWFSDESGRYVDLVKGIKKKHGNCSFVDVMLTAVSASLYNYANKKSPLLPKQMTAVVTILPTSNKPYKYGEVENYELKNKFTIAMVKVPLKTDVYDEAEDLKMRLKMVCEDYNIMKNKALDTTFNRWQGRVLFTNFPTQIMAPMYKCGQPTFLFSNIPGCGHLDIFGGCAVKEFVVFDPNVAVSGISVMITTYENRLNIAFTFDKSIVPNAEEGNRICHDVLANLERLNIIL